MRDGPQRGQLLDRLMGRTVFAEADGIVRHDEDRPDLHHRRQADRRAAVVREAQEGAAVGDQAAVQRDAVHGRGHAVLAHAVMHVGAVVFAGLDLDHALGLGVVRGRQIGRASQQFRNRGGQMVEHGAAGGAGRHFLAARDELGAGRRDGLLPVGRQLAVVAALEFGAQFGRRRLDAVRPGHAGRAALCADLAPLAQQRLGDHERRRIPAEDLPRAGDFLFAGRVAVGLLRCRPWSGSRSR